MLLVKRFAFLCLLIAFIGVDSVFSQNNIPDSSAKARAISRFREKMGAQLKLFNGTEHLGYPRDMIGNPYYLNTSLVNGTVVYAGIMYNDVPLMYDMVSDHLIIKYYNTPFNIALSNVKLNSFDFSGHHFVRVVPADSISGLAEGNYDQLYHGRYSLLARRQAFQKDVIVGQKAFSSVSPKIFYFIIKDSVAHPVSNVRSALKIVEDKGEVKAYLRKSGLKRRADKEVLLKRIVSYYDQRNSQ